LAAISSRGSHGDLAGRWAKLLWLPPVMQEVFDRFSASDRLRASFRPVLSGISRSRGRYGDQRIGSKSWESALGSKFDNGFPNPDLFDRCAHSGHCTLTLPLAPTLAGYDMSIMPRSPAPDLGNPRSSSASPRSGGPSCSPAKCQPTSSVSQPLSDRASCPQGSYDAHAR
jgi:hypothetical protein